MPPVAACGHFGPGPAFAVRSGRGRIMTCRSHSLVGLSFTVLVLLAAGCPFETTPTDLQAVTDGGARTDATPPPAGECRRGGCSGELCMEVTTGKAGASPPSDCLWRSEFACYQAARCERQTNGACGFTGTDELKACLGKNGVCFYNGASYRPGQSFPSTDGCNTCSCTEGGGIACTRRACPVPPPAGECRRGGCSGEICFEVQSGAAGDPPASPCLWRPEFACYQAARCERQSTGKCGFTLTAEVNACLRKNGVCAYNGSTYQSGQSFPSTDGCNTCTCTESGGLACTERACPPPR